MPCSLGLWVRTCSWDFYFPAPKWFLVNFLEAALPLRSPTVGFGHLQRVSSRCLGSCRDVCPPTCPFSRRAAAPWQMLPSLFLLCRVRTKPCALCASANLFTCRSYGIFKNEEEGLRLCLAFWDAAGAWVWSCVPGRVFWLLLQLLFIQFYKILAGIKSTYQGVGFYESHGMWKSSWLDELWLHIPDKHNDSIYSDLAARTQIDSVGNKFSQPQNFSGNQPDPAQKKCMQGSRLGLQKYVRLLFHVCVPVS